MSFAVGGLNSLTSVMAEFPITLSLQKWIEPHVFVLSILQFVWQDLGIACKSFNSRKKYINHGNLMNGQKLPFKKVFSKNRFFIKIAVLQSIKLIARSKTFKNTSEEILFRGL